jgi:hypothetical protein
MRVGPKPDADRAPGAKKGRAGIAGAAKIVGEKNDAAGVRISE